MATPMNPIHLRSAFTLVSLLYNANVPYEFRLLYEGWQLRFSWDEGDVACHNGTYGNAAGLVETYQFPWDNGDVSMLTPEECAERIITYYNEIKPSL